MAKAKPSQKAKPKRQAKEPEQVSAEGEHLLKALSAEASDYNCALIGTAHLEQALMSLLSRFFIKADTSDGLFRLGGILGEYSACCQMAYCLGLIPKATYNNLIEIGNVRNKFAHSATAIDFKDEEVVGYCDTLTLPTLLPADQTPRSRFLTVAATMYGRTLLDAHGIERRPKHPGISGETA